MSDLEIPHLNVANRKKLISTLRNYGEVFYQEKESVSFTNKIKQKINTQNFLSSVDTRKSTGKRSTDKRS